MNRISIKEASKLTGSSIHKIYYMIRQGFLKATKRGENAYVDKEEILAIVGLMRKKQENSQEIAFLKKKSLADNREYQRAQKQIKREVQKTVAKCQKIVERCQPKEKKPRRKLSPEEIEMKKWEQIRLQDMKAGIITAEDERRRLREMYSRELAGGIILPAPDDEGSDNYDYE